MTSFFIIEHNFHGAFYPKNIPELLSALTFSQNLG